MNVTADTPVPTRSPMRVLCVDDRADNADSEVLLVEMVGFEARASYSGAEALAEAERFRPDVCLIDLNMPGMNGDVLAVRLRALLDTTPTLIAVTAMNNEPSVARIKEAGFDYHLVKPVDPVVLIDTLNEIRRSTC